MDSNIQENVSMSIYRPYFYIIQHKTTGIYYAGSKYAKDDSNPDMFMQPGGYFTSSNIVKALIETDGAEAFVIRKIRIFKTSEEARNYESRFLSKVNAKNNNKFYNRHNNDGYCDPDYAKERMLELYGVDNFAKSPEFTIRFRNKCQEKYGVDHHLQNPEIYAKHQNTCMERYGVDNVFKDSKIRENARQTKLEKYGDANFVNPEKAKTTCIEKYGVTHHAKLDSRRSKQIEIQKDMYNRPIVADIKSLIESARELELNMKQFKLSTYWWSRNSNDLQDLQQRLTLAIEEKQSSGFIKRSRSQKMKDINAALFNRQIVTDIKTYASVTGTKLGPAWWRQSDEVLANLLAELKVKPYIHA
jgi:hypothetical protein